ncbi:hypothetical protein [Pedobacter psychrodurus]|uniref:hypothetical protein n=1 Tax=Pedobacter psychrodurus TaxID=2530456 RepID=UPI00292D856E|nr:hypothetical protein [Pedobacter psychrodurus]
MSWEFSVLGAELHPDKVWRLCAFLQVPLLEERETWVGAFNPKVELGVFNWEFSVLGAEPHPDKVWRLCAVLQVLLLEERETRVGAFNPKVELGLIRIANHCRKQEKRFRCKNTTHQ